MLVRLHGSPHWPSVGVFAQRNKRRPNRIGVCTCELLEVNGLELTVRGLDAIDGSPVLGLKPYMTEFAPRVRQPAGRRSSCAASGSGAPEAPEYHRLPRAVSSAGRAPALQAGGHWFEPSTAHLVKRCKSP